jgi:hypothetical protein
MKRTHLFRKRTTLIAQMLGAAILTSSVVGAPSSGRADEQSALKVLKSMADFLKAQSTLTLKYDADVEILTPAIEKIQFSASGEVTLSRPDRFRMTRTGGYADVELVFDGARLTMHDRGGKRFAQIPASGSIDQAIERVRTEFLTELPGADLLLSKPYEELASGVLEAKHIGRGVVEGVECEHLAFRNLETDWQMWVEVGERPTPRKYVITSKTVTAAPQYTLRLRDWKFGIALVSDSFTFNPPTDSSGVPVATLTEIDEIPNGQVSESTK